jgi:hypothetical protein
VEPFDLPAKLPSDPFGLRLPSSRRFHRAGRISTGYPLPDSHSTAQPRPRLSAPRQGFLPPRIKASIQLRDRKLTVAVRPISLRSPPASSLITSASGSPFQVRYVPPGSPFREPLGTISIMPQAAFQSTEICARKCAFLRFYLLYLQRVTWTPRWNSCG